MFFKDTLWATGDPFDPIPYIFFNLFDPFDPVYTNITKQTVEIIISFISPKCRELQGDILLEKKHYQIKHSDIQKVPVFYIFTSQSPV